MASSAKGVPPLPPTARPDADTVLTTTQVLEGTEQAKDVVMDIDGPNEKSPAESKKKPEPGMGSYLVSALLLEVTTC